MRVSTFTGLVPKPEFASEVAAVPYDVVNRDEAAALARNKPHNLLHVDRAEIDLPADTDPYSDLVYMTARRNFLRLQAEGVLVRENHPALYFYRQRMGRHTQTGIIAACHVEDYEKDIIRKHEKTRKVKEEDRTRLVDTLSAHTGPVFLTYRDVGDIDAIEQQATRSAPIYDFVAEDGIAHTVWRVTGDAAQSLVALFVQQVPLAYVADGHHRSASAARVAASRRAQNPDHTGSEDYNWFLGVLFPATQLQILPYNRVVRDLDNHSPETLLGAIRAAGFRVLPAVMKEPPAPRQVHLYTAGNWHALRCPEEPAATPVEALDVSVLQRLILAPLLGIHDPRTSDRIEFVGGIRGPEALERLVDSGQAGCAFSMYPVTVEQLMAISDAGEIMPPKSTWFEPKLRSGLVIQTF
ncbi:MAG: DUF1015 domain-containing protein [Verrucomicrobiales bacterium]